MTIRALCGGVLSLWRMKFPTNSGRFSATAGNNRFFRMSNILRWLSCPLGELIWENNALLVPENWIENFLCRRSNSEFFRRWRVWMFPLFWLAVCFGIEQRVPGLIHSDQLLQKMRIRGVSLTFLQSGSFEFLAVEYFWHPAITHFCHLQVFNDSHHCPMR